MKKFILITLLSALAILTFGQNNDHSEDYDFGFFNKEKENKNKECDTRVQLADSAISFAVNPQNGSLKPVQVVKYFYDSNFNLTEIFFISLPSRLNISHQIYEYDSNGNILRYVNQLWKNNEWVDDLINTRTYSSEGLIQYEEYLRKNSSGIFAAYMRHYYNYQGSVIINYLRQMLDAKGKWYDFSHHFYVYDSLGRLTVLYGQYLNDGPVFWERKTTFNFDNEPTERYLRILRYNTILKKNVLTNTQYQTFSYNIFGNVSEIMNYSWTNNQWIYSSKEVYYYSLLHDKKVAICHNGHSLCVSVNAVQAHLEHGDKLGKCDINNFDNRDGQGEKDNDKSEQKNDNSPKFSVFPNPATDNITISLPDDKEKYEKGYLMSSGGQMVASFEVKGRNQITVDLSGLQTGTYFIKMMKKDKIETLTVIKK